MENTLRFFWNGIKASDGKLQAAYFWDSELRNYPAGTITISAKNYSGFSAQVAEAFEIQNHTDSQTDYFEHDTIRVTPTHPLYSQVKASMDARKMRNEKLSQKRRSALAVAR